METPEILFLKLYIKIFKDEGLLARLGATRLHTLIGLALFIDKDGYCYPSQSLLAKYLGITPTQVNHRIKELAKFKYKGFPIIIIRKVRSKDGQWQSNFYAVMSRAGIRIFNQEEAV